MDKVHKTFHYMDMTCDVAFISSAIFNLRRVGLPDVFATFIYSSSPPHQKKNQLSEWANKLPRNVTVCTTVSEKCLYS